MAEEEQHLSTNRARAGETRGHMRYVLLASLALIIVLFAALLALWG